LGLVISSWELMDRQENKVTMHLKEMRCRPSRIYGSGQVPRTFFVYERLGFS
jgi:hypothetical protein